jgi:hypothetical protein
MMDDICLVRSMKGDDNEHANATPGMHTGSFFFSRPSIGSWVSYGLGTMNSNLPSFVALAPQMPYAGTQIFNNDFVHDFHATILHLLGLNHEKLTYRHGGRYYRLTDVFGNVVKDILA